MKRKTRRARACDISTRVRNAVSERDGGLCILCGRVGEPNAHYVPRSAGGLGIEQNVVTLCMECHHRYDNTAERVAIGAQIEEYLASQYDGWNKQDLYYRKTW